MKEKKESKIYLLDTSAVLTLWNAEHGADTVEDILKKSSDASVFVSFMTFMECKYALWKKKGKTFAEEFHRDLTLLPVKRVDVDDELIDIAAEIKATNSLSVADSWIIASAIKTDATLVHKDPEFEQVAGKIDMLKLPYK